MMRHEISVVEKYSAPAISFTQLQGPTHAPSTFSLDPSSADPESVVFLRFSVRGAGSSSLVSSINARYTSTAVPRNSISAAALTTTSSFSTTMAYNIPDQKTPKPPGQVRSYPPETSTGKVEFTVPSTGEKGTTIYRIWGKLSPDVTPLICLHGGPGMLHRESWVKMESKTSAKSNRRLHQTD